jgi:hypothetical protein
MSIHNLWLEKTQSATQRVENLLDNEWLNLSDELKTEFPNDIFPK